MPKDRTFLHHVSSGFVKGFYSYLVPMSAIASFRSKKLVISPDHAHTAFALGALVSAFRFFQKLFELTTLTQQEIEERKDSLDTYHDWLNSKYFQIAKNLLLKFPSVFNFLRRYKEGLAGMFSVLVGSAISPNLASPVFSIWVTVRAARHLLPEIKSDNEAENEKERERDHSHNFFYSTVAPTAVMCLSAGHILSTWINAPSELAPSYLNFLYVHGGKSPVNTLISAIEQRILLTPTSNPCEILHPDTNCRTYWISYIFSEIPRALKIYIPVHLILTGMAYKKERRKGTSNLEIVTEFLTNLSRSTIFLTFYCFLGWSSACVYFGHMFPGTIVTRARMWRHVWTAGLPILLEKPRRRVELASYCLTYAIESVCRSQYAKQLVNFFGSTPETFPVSRFSNILLAVSAGVVMHHYKSQSQLVSNIFGLHSN